MGNLLPNPPQPKIIAVTLPEQQPPSYTELFETEDPPKELQEIKQDLKKIEQQLQWLKNNMATKHKPPSAKKIAKERFFGTRKPPFRDVHGHPLQGIDEVDEH